MRSSYCSAGIICEAQVLPAVVTRFANQSMCQASWHLLILLWLPVTATTVLESRVNSFTQLKIRGHHIYKGSGARITGLPP